jgi:hypothetical protein
LKNDHEGINVYINDCDPLGNLGSFSEDSPTLTAGEVDGSYSLSTRYTPVTTTASPIIQLYSQSATNGTDSDARYSCPSVNKDATKVGADIDEARVTGVASFMQATGLEIIAENIDLGDSTPGNISFAFAFKSGFGTDDTSDFYRGTLNDTVRYQFCVREILQLDESSGDPVVVDVMEIPLDFIVTLDGKYELTSGFEVQSVSVAGDTAVLNTTYTVDIYPCAFPSAPTVSITPAPAYSQGDVVELCVRSANYPLASVVNILSLDFKIESLGGVSVTYEAINSALTDFDEATDCDTFENTDGVTEQICGVRVLLPINLFFAAGTGSGSREVTVTGTSLLQVGDSAGRRLVTVGGSSGRRELQQGSEQEASFSMSVETVVPENSGGFSMIVASNTGAIIMAIFAGASLHFF